MKLDVTVETKLASSGRVKQISAMFDVPASDVSRLSWFADLPLDARSWSVGLIVGPSGSGKSTCLRALFGAPVAFRWGAPSVLDDFGKTYGVEAISAVCQAVGFNTIPAWLRPFKVLSVGEQFRASLARMLLEASGDPIVIDEFTSVVDRQVAKIGAHAVQKHIRASSRRLVAATCHGDVEDWLQPDWVFEPATMTFRWREVQRRPALAAVVQRVPRSAWGLFAPFHYLTHVLHRAAACYGLFVDGQLVTFAGTLHRPHARVRDVTGVSRLVTLPDWQGLGLGPRLIDLLGAWHAAIGHRLHIGTSAFAFVRGLARSTSWVCIKRPGDFSTLSGTIGRPQGTSTMKGKIGGSPSATFEYRGPIWPDPVQARAILDGVSAA